MVGDTPDFNEGQIGNTKRIASSHFSLLSFKERLWRYLPRCGKPAAAVPQSHLEGTREGGKCGEQVEDTSG